MRCKPAEVLVAFLIVAAPCQGAGDGDVKKHLTDLRDKSATTRRLAAEALGLLASKAPPEALAGLGQALADSDETVRNEAAMALANVGPPTVPVLAKALQSDNAKARLLAAIVLRSFGKDAETAVPPLAAALSDQESEVRVRAAAALEAIGPRAKAALPALLAACKDPSNARPLPRGTSGSSVCVAALKAIKSIDPTVLGEAAQGTVSVLLAALKSDEAGSNVAAEALRELGPRAQSAIPELKRLFLDSKSASAQAAGWALLGLGEESRRAVAEIVQNDKLDLKSRLALIYGLRQSPTTMGAPPDVLRALLKDKEPAIRREAVTALGTYGAKAKAAVADLAELLDDQELLKLPVQGRSHQTFPAAHALAAIGEPAVPALTKALKSDKVVVRWQAAKALALLGRKAKPALEALRATLDDKFTAVVIESACALVRMDAEPRQALQVLEEGLLHNKAAVRLAAVDAIGRIGPRAGSLAPLLEKMLDDDELGFAGYEAITKLGPEGSGAVPKLAKLLRVTDVGPRLNALRLLSAFGPLAKEAVPLILPQLDDKDEDIQSYALAALASIGPAAKRAVPDLMDKTKTAGGRRWMFAEALGKVGPAAADAVPALMPLLTSDSYLDRKYAAQALGRIGLPAKEAVPALQKLLQDPERGVRAWAAFALAKINIERDGPVQALTEIYRHHKIDVQATFARAEAVSALRELGPVAKGALPILIDAARGPALLTAVEAMEALVISRADAKEVVPVLTELLGHRDAYGRATAARALGSLGPAAKDAVPRLTELLNDDDEAVADAAEDAIARIQAKDKST